MESTADPGPNIEVVVYQTKWQLGEPGDLNKDPYGIMRKFVVFVPSGQPSDPPNPSAVFVFGPPSRFLSTCKHREIVGEYSKKQGGLRIEGAGSSAVFPSETAQGKTLKLESGSTELGGSSLIYRDQVLTTLSSIIGINVTRR